MISLPSHVATPLSPVLRPLATESHIFLFLTCAEEDGSPLRPSMKTRSPIEDPSGGVTSSTLDPSSAYQQRKQSGSKQLVEMRMQSAIGQKAFIVETFKMSHTLAARTMPKLANPTIFEAFILQTTSTFLSWSSSRS